MKKKRFIGLYLEDDLFRWIDGEAKLKRSSMSQVVREAIVYKMNGAEAPRLARVPRKVNH